MENKYFDYDLVKEKFAMLISKLHDAGLLIDYINQTIVESSFFDCFEKNDLGDFMSQSFEMITKNVFKKEVIYDYSHSYINPYYWAGLNIMEIMMNLNVPLKRIITIMPIKEIVGCYDVYHEMNIDQFLDHYQNIENNRSLLKILRNDANYSVGRISYLTGIKPSLLNLMNNSNATLFATSFSNLNKLATLFNVSLDIFKAKSSYIAFSYTILDNEQFKKIFVKNILNYFNVVESDVITTKNNYLKDKEIRDMLKTNKTIVILSNPFGILNVSSNRINRKYLNEKEFFFIYQKTIVELKNQLNQRMF